jgi:hypothetical protein
MGRSFLFTCPQCRYRAAVTGGVERGAHAIVQTLHCFECAALYEAPIRLRLADAQIDLRQRLQRGRMLNRPLQLDRPVPAWDRRLAHAGARKSHWVAVKLRCPVSSLHRVEVWRDPGKCPRCGHLLNRALLPAREWE